jgi:hypothetical protein
MPAGSNTALLMNGTLEVLAPSISDHYTQRFHVSRVYSFIRDWDGVRLIATRLPPIETPKCRSSGASNTMCRSIMSVTPAMG